MPRVSRWMIRAAVMYLVAALALGVLMRMPAATTYPALAVVWPVYLHVLVLGWLTQLIFGVAFWMFPRHSAEQPRGSERLAWAAFALLNSGLVLRAFAEPWHTVSGRGGSVLVVSAALQLLAGLAFATNTWPRVRER